MKQLAWKIVLTTAYRLARIYWFVRRPKTQGAYVAVWLGDEILLIRNSYKSGWTFPAGGIHAGETVLDAAIREAWEEVGLRLEATDLRLAGEFTTYCEFKEDRSSVFEVILQDKPRLQIDCREVEAAQFVPFDELDRWPLNEIATLYVEWKRTDVAQSSHI